MRLRDVKTVRTNITSSLDLRQTYDKVGVISRQLAKNSSKYVYRLEIYNYETMKQLSTIDIYQTYQTKQHYIKFVSDRNLVSVATKFQVKFYQIQPLQLKKNFLHQQADIYDLQASHDGQLVVLVGHEIKMWQTNGFRPAIFPHVIQSARYCSFSKDKTFFAIASNNQIYIYTYFRDNGQYSFNPLNPVASPVQNQDITSLQFNPINSNQLIVGFLNVSPQVFRIDSGFFVPMKDIQPLASKNPKIATYMPDGKRFISTDNLKGVGVWPGVSDTLYYVQGYLLYHLHPNALGTQFIGRVWQNIKVVQIQVQCKPQVFQDQCECPADSSWDFASYSCQPLSCLQRQNATGQKKNNQCVCIQGYKFNNVLKKCIIDCQKIDKAVTINPNTGFCYCRDNYTWDQATKKCIFNCREIPHSTGVLISAQKCQCLSGFEWSTQFKQCVCPKYSKALGNTCVCYQYYQELNGRCVIDCNKITKSAGPLQTQQQCLCQNGYYFTQYEGKVGCKLNCTNFNDTRISSSFQKCQCVQNMNWVDNMCKINCGDVEFASGQVTGAINQCKCAVNYIWIDQIHECGKNCTGFPFVNMSKRSTLRSCPCIQNFEWLETNQKCAIDCGKVVNAQKYNLTDPAKCDCRDAFNWIQNKLICQIDCTKIWDARQKVDDKTCTCNNNKNFNSTINVCQAAASESFFSSIWTILGLVASAIVFILIMIVLVRYCWQFKTKNNRQHDKKLKTNDMGSKPRKRKVKKDRQERTLISDQRLRTKTTL